MPQGVTIDFNANIARFTSSIDKATSKLNKFQSNASRIAGNLKSVFGALGVGLGIAGIAALVKSSINAQDEISKLSQKTGIAVESLAGLGFAAELSGTDVDTVGKAVRKFSVLINDANRGLKTAQDEIEDLGLDFKKLKDLSPEEQFFKLADAIKEFGTEDRAAALTGVLGDKMAALVPLVSLGADGMRKLTEEGKILNPVTAESAAKAEEFNDNLYRLKKSVGTFGVNVASGMVGPLTDITNAMILAQKESGFLMAALVALGGVGAFLFTGTFDTNADKLKKLTIQLNENQKAVDRILDARKRGAISAPVGIEDDLLKRMAEGKAEIAKLEKILNPPFVLNDKKSSRVLVDRVAAEARAKETERGIKKQEDALTKFLNAQQASIEKQSEFNALQKAGIFLNTIGKTGEIESVRQLVLGQAAQIDAEKELSDARNLSRAQSVAEGDAFAAQSESIENARKAMLDLAEPTASLLRQLSEFDKFEGFIDPEILDAARFAIQNQIEDLGKLKDTGKDTFADLQAAVEGWGNASAQALVDFVVTGKASFGSFAQSVIADLAKMAIQQAITKPLFAFIGGFLPGAPVKSAKGNVFNSPGLSSFSGSVVSRPTLFPFASGIGLMGEAGAEAILPLKRGSDGKLGVSGGGGGAVTVSVSVDASGTKAEGDSAQSSALGRMIGGAIRGVLLQEKMPGGLLA